MGVLILAGLGLLFVVFSVWYWKSGFGRRTGATAEYGAYVQTIEAFGIVVALVSFLVAIIADERQRVATANAESMALTQVGWNEVERYFADHNRDLTRLYKQLYADNAALQHIPDPPDTPEVRSQEVHAVSQLFQVIDNTNWLVQDRFGGWGNPDNADWLAVFRSWFRSPILQQHWPAFRVFYDRDMQGFVDDYLWPLSRR